MTFDGDDYRKRVLAAVQRRGGVPASDPFEWYDLPLTDVRDSTAQQQVDAVWAFWQKQRDSPRYRGLVTALLAEHRSVAPLLLAADSRRVLAEQVRTARAARQDDRSGTLDVAAQRLVDRLGGVPRSKLAGLRAVGLAAGLSAAEVEARLAALPVVEVASTPVVVVPAAVVRQLRADLDELGRLLGRPPPTTLYDLLGLPPGAPPDAVQRERQEAAARNRQLRPDRQRALVDDLLAAVTSLLVETDGQAYLDAVTDEVTDRLRPHLAAAVLVEDVLTAGDAQGLLDQALALGLDRDRAVLVVEALAREAGTPVPAGLRAGTPGPAPVARAAERGAAARGPAAAVGPDSPELAVARACLAAGRAAEAEQRLVAALRRDAGPAARALDAEVRAVLEEARGRWRRVESALAGRRWAEAAAELDRLATTAVDLPGPSGRSVDGARQEARDGLARATAGAESGDEAALLAAWEQAPDSPAVLARLQGLGVQPPSDVRVERTGGGARAVWRPSRSPGPVEYRVLRVRPDGSRVPLGSTRGTSLEDGAVRPGDALPEYVVLARRAGVLSAEARSGAPSSDAEGAPASCGAPAGAPSTAVPAAGALAPVPALTAAVVRGRLALTWTPPASGRVEVRRLPAGALAPKPGRTVDPATLGALVPLVAPRLAAEPRPPQAPTCFVAVTCEGGRAVAGAWVLVADLPDLPDLRREHGRLRWTWPDGVDEAVVLVRDDAPPVGPGDPAARSRTVHRDSRDQVESGAGHVAVAAGSRLRGVLVTGTRLARLLPESPQARAGTP